MSISRYWITDKGEDLLQGYKERETNYSSVMVGHHWFAVLNFISNHGHASSWDVINNSGLEQAQTIKALDQLESAGYLTREEAWE